METLYDKASLILNPGIYDTGKVYCTKPLDGSGDLTFTRASNATRVNSSGLIEKAKVNLLLQSNTFLTASWDVSSVTLTGGQSGYDGSSDAWKFESNVTNANTFQIISTSGVSTFSVYAKAGNASWIRLRYDNNSTTDVNLWCNLTDGSLGVDNGVSSYTENIGGGWYRIVVQANTNDLNNLRIYPATGDGLNSNAGDNIYIQDAQLNYGLSAQEYQETTTTSVVSGITNDMPRLDYSGGASCPSLLLEPQRTNLVTSTEYLEYGWSLANNATISFQSVTAPDGSGLVAKIESTTGDTSGRNQDSLGTLGTNHVFSGFFKGTGVATRLRFRNNQGEQVQYNIDASGNFTLHTSDSANYGIEDFPNGWKRIWLETTTSGAATNYIQIYPDTNNGTGSVYAWGMQAEEGSYVTSYIPNYGLTSGITRTVEQTYTSSNGINTTSGTWFLELGADWNSGSYGSNVAVLQVVPSSGTGYISLLSNQTANTLRARVYDGTTFQYIGGSFAPEAPNKFAFKWDASEIKFFRNGVLIGSTPWANSRVFSGISLPDTSRAALYHIEQTLCFPNKLTDADCIALTQ